MLTARLPASMIDALTDWSEKNGLSRSAAVRALLDHALASPPPHQKTAMAQLPSEPAGMERDNRGRAIPIKKRLPEDRAVAKKVRIQKRHPPRSRKS